MLRWRPGTGTPAESPDRSPANADGRTPDQCATTDCQAIAVTAARRVPTLSCACCRFKALGLSTAETAAPTAFRPALLLFALFRLELRRAVTSDRWTSGFRRPRSALYRQLYLKTCDLELQPGDVRRCCCGLLVRRHLAGSLVPANRFSRPSQLYRAASS